MKNFAAETPPSRTAKLSDASRTMLTSFKSFNLYDTNIFATFFFSDIEKIWLVIVKNGLITLNGTVVKTCGILHNFSLIDFDTTRIEFVNMRDEIGLSQILVERFLTTNNCKISDRQILELSNTGAEKGLVFGCLRKNSLFYRDTEGWGLDYKNYIDFLEQRNDPFIDSVLLEFENTLTATGPYQTFSISTIWTSTSFSDERLGIGDDELLNNGFGRYKGIPNWPHSSRAAGADGRGSPGRRHTGRSLEEAAPADTDPQEGKRKPAAETSQASDAPESASSGSNNTKHLNTLFDQFTIRGRNFSSLRRCYSSADDSRYLEGYRIWDFSEGSPEKGAYENPSSTSNESACTVRRMAGSFSAPGDANLGGDTLYSTTNTDSDFVSASDRFDLRMGPAAACKREVRGDVLSVSKYNFVKNYVIDFTSSNFTESSDRFSAGCSQSLGSDSGSLAAERTSSAEEEALRHPGPDTALSLVYSQKAYAPKKRKCVPPPAKRYKFFIVIDISPVVHRLPDYTSNLVITSTCFSDCEIGGGERRPPARPRSVSNTEERSFVGRDFDYDLIALYRKKKRIGGRAPHQGRCTTIR